MSIETPIGTSPGMPAGAASGTGPTGSDDTGVKQTAQQAAQQAKEQTKVVASEAKQHVTQLVGQTRGEVRQQVDQRSQQLTSSLNGLAGQLRSLRDGRPDEAGPLHHYLIDAEQKVSGWAQRLEQGGPDQMLRDVRMFARRRPGAFLLAALGAGFVAGRAVRVGVAAAQEQQDGQQGAIAGYGQSPALPPNAYPTGSVTDPAYGAPIAPSIDPTLPAAGSEAFA